MQTLVTRDTDEADHAERDVKFIKRSGCQEPDTDLFSSSVATERANDAITLAHDPGSDPCTPQ